MLWVQPYWHFKKRVSSGNFGTNGGNKNVAVEIVTWVLYMVLISGRSLVEHRIGDCTYMNNSICWHTWFQSQDKKATSESKALGTENVGGVFLVLIVGVALACVRAIWELLWEVGCRSFKEDVSTFQIQYNGNLSRTRLLFQSYLLGIQVSRLIIVFSYLQTVSQSYIPVIFYRFLLKMRWKRNWNSSSTLTQKRNQSDDGRVFQLRLTAAKKIVLGTVLKVVDSCQQSSQRRLKKDDDPFERGNLFSAFNAFDILPLWETNTYLNIYGWARKF